MGKTRVYVGNLPANIRERDIEDIFRKYGKIGNLDLRTNKGPPFAFLDFDDSRDADDAIQGRDGYDYDGYKIRVEYPRSYRDGDRRGGRGGGGGGFDDRRGGYGDRNGDRRGFDSGRGGGGGRRNDGIRRSKYRIVISGLPPSGSWQDLKDHMREAGDVCFADVTRDGSGHVEFLREEDMKYAIKKLDDTKFRSHEGETSYIRIKADDGSSSGGRRRSRSRSHSRSASGDRRSRSRSPITRPARGASPDEAANGKERGSTKRERSDKRERSASRSPKRSVHSKSRSPSKSGASRSVSRERE